MKPVPIGHFRRGLSAGARSKPRSTGAKLGGDGAGRAKASTHDPAGAAVAAWTAWGGSRRGEPITLSSPYGLSFHHLIVWSLPRAACDVQPGSSLSPPLLPIPEGPQGWRGSPAPTAAAHGLGGGQWPPLKARPRTWAMFGAATLHRRESEPCLRPPGPGGH